MNGITTQAAMMAPSGFNFLTLAPALWLDGSDHATVLDSGNNPADPNEAVQSWRDKSGNGRHATTSLGTIIRKAAFQNGLDVLQWPSGGTALMTFARLTNVRTMLLVLKERAPVDHFLMGDSGAYDFCRGLYPPDYTLWDASWASASVKNGTTRKNGQAVNGTTTPLGTGFNLITLVTTGNTAAAQLTRDRNIPGRSWDGEIAEVLLCTDPLPDALLFPAERALAAKWGIALP